MFAIRSVASGCDWKGIGAVRYNFGQSILNALKTGSVLQWSTVQNGIDVVQARRDECGCNGSGHTIIEGRTNLPERTNVIKQELDRECFGVRFHGEIRIECSTKNFDFSR